LLVLLLRTWTTPPNQTWVSSSALWSGSRRALATLKQPIPQVLVPRFVLPATDVDDCAVVDGFGPAHPAPRRAREMLKGRIAVQLFTPMTGV
jgi:hypothetical protein